MCSWCEPTFDGYVFWDGVDLHDTTFRYKNNPSEYRIKQLETLIRGPLDLTIPYV